MKRLTVETMGDDVQGVRLKGDRHNPEPIYFRVVLPFGDVDIARTSDDEYWVHVRVNHEGDGDHVAGERVLGVFRDARIDARGEHAGTIPADALAHPGLNHVAVLVAPRKEPKR